MPLAIVGILPNPTWIRVRLPDGKTADLRVRNSASLQPNTRIPCQETPTGWRVTHSRYAIRN